MATKTLIGTILAEHLAEGAAVPGTEIRVRIDQTLLQDATGTMAFLEFEAMGVPRIRNELAVQYVDHNTSQFGPENQNDHLYLQSVAAAKGVHFSRPGNGICHQVHLERFGVPGKTLLGSDSHTPTNGGLGMVAIGAGGLDVAAAMAGEPFKMQMPKIVGVRLTGELPPWVAAKDVILHVLSILTTKGNVGTALEYFGPGVASLSVPERATIANMGAELGVTCSVFPSDEVTRSFLRAQGREDAWRALGTEAGAEAEYERVLDVDLSTLVPLAACPSSPDAIRPVEELSDVRVAQVIIGSCTNSSLKDVTRVAEVLSGRTVHPDVSLLIAPGSRQVLQMIAESGELASLIASGARIAESACGPCIGQGASPAEGEATVRTFNRNFAGRTGTKGDRCYLVSPETAVATALNGRLTDPRTLGQAPPEFRQPDHFTVDDGMVVPPPPEGEAVDIVRKSTIGDPPRCTPLPDPLVGEVVIAVGDKITTDHIMPAGTYLKLRSNIPNYARFVFECFNEPGRAAFAESAAAVRDAGRAGVIVAGESYGQGSSREHAAICPMYLGVRVVLALSIERIHAANLVNFGILPLLFARSEDRERIEPGDQIVIEDVAEQLRSGDGVVTVALLKNGERCAELRTTHGLSAEDCATILAGGRLNMID